jgi:hypothetical protein
MFGACEKNALIAWRGITIEQYQKTFAFTGNQQMSALVSLGAPNVTAVCAAQ